MPVDEILRPAAQVRDGRPGYVNAQVVIQRREDFPEIDRPAGWLAAEAVGGADHLPRLHAPAGQQREGRLGPVLAPAVLVDLGAAAEFAPHYHGDVLIQP